MTHECTEENWHRVIAINLTGVWLCMKAEIAQMLKQGSGGAIVNTSSRAGLVGSAGGPAYVAVQARRSRPHQDRGARIRPTTAFESMRSVPARFVRR